IAENVLRRDFVASAPNRKWLADITYVPSAEGWLYAAFVLDLFSRKIVGWAMSSTMPQTLTLAALQVALGWRDPDPGQLVHHSDRGSQYAAEDYRKVLAARGIEVSMSAKGDCWDNAPMESFNGTLKVECVHGERFETREQARQALVEFVGYYNTERRHSSLGNVAPALYEQALASACESRASCRRQAGGCAPPAPPRGTIEKIPDNRRHRTPCHGSIGSGLAPEIRPVETPRRRPRGVHPTGTGSLDYIDTEHHEGPGRRGRTAARMSGSGGGSQR
ncbi:MAG TPA: IS3 family transposase, partial [Burkholderiaceae bacterium]|nr:IS3 family transposase [Burkholderiaceae bacterium]